MTESKMKTLSNPPLTPHGHTIKTLSGETSVTGTHHLAFNENHVEWHAEENGILSYSRVVRIDHLFDEAEEDEETGLPVAEFGAPSQRLWLQYQDAADAMVLHSIVVECESPDAAGLLHSALKVAHNGWHERHGDMLGA